MTRKVLLLLFLVASAAPAHADRAADIRALGCAGYEPATTEVSFAASNGAPQVINGVSFPAHEETLFRGAYESNRQFDLTMVVRGIFRENNWYVGSPMFFLAHEILMGRRTLNGDFFPSGQLPHRAHEYFAARGSLAPLKTLLACRAPGFYTDGEANLLAADLMNKGLGSFSREQLEEKYFDMGSSDYYSNSVQEMGFGNNAADFVISSFYDQIAALYGHKTLVMKDRRHRALDLTFFNKLKRGMLFDYWIDAGEVNAPGYVDADEILGIQLRTMDRDRYGIENTYLRSKISYAVYRHQVGEKSFGLVIDGEDTTACMLHGSDGRLYGCADYWGDGEPLRRGNAPVPGVTDESLANRRGLIGILNDCDNQCGELAEIQRWYGKSSPRVLSAEIIAKMAGFKVNGKEIHFKKTVTQQ